MAERDPDPDADDFEHHPELAGYQRGDERPLRHPMTLKVMRIVVILGVAGLVLPGVIATIGVQARTADASCEIVVARAAPGATAAIARFELFGAEGPAWYCYARDFDGTEVLVSTLGFIPGLSEPRPPVDSNPT